MQRDVFLLMISRVARSFAAGLLAVIVGLYYVHVLHLSLLQVGILFGVGAFVTPLLTLILGFYSDRYGRKKILLITLSFLPLSVLILLLTSNFFLLMLSSALGGFGIAGGLVGGGVGASVAPMQTALLTEKVKPEERTKIFSWFTIISSYAGSAGALLANGSSYEELFIISLLVSGLSALAVIPVKENFKPRRKEEPKAASKDNDVIKKFTLTGILNGVSQGLIVPFIPIIFSEVYGLSQGFIGDLVSLGGVISASAMLATPALTERLGFVRLIIITRTISAVMVLLFPFLGVWYLASIDYVLFTPLRVIALPAQQALMMNLVGEGRRATATGANQAGRLIPAAASTSLSGYIMHALSFAIPFEAAFVATIVNSFLYFKFFRGVDKAVAGKVVLSEG
ncbi:MULTISPECIES: MFS transporter [Metallosphaera]|uniref:Major facilitator superfamily MFS_1 n=3 Tax=Metallosphaera TaxID=41980 RepID=A4YFM9_METS5|nr:MULTISPECIES: MFS transporter [Metallosphaera]ABP95231.1 major facilitator superfamily MFS_1 [Metallosphaera sedula DSM 5348]AIM27217.1 major facilitator superfamily MFS_1 [Metallosphaera sedula]AKV74111.1 MFS transporter [Metallosphaera sedula]AKV76351.1 MFS transporter [Metallosphaera sedula]AKV78602.1 MFS transporter [Metallosphaera sedula]